MENPALHVITPGMFTSLQDTGRPGFLQAGFPRSGALDEVAMRLANSLVGNTPTEGLLEAFYIGPHLRIEAGSARIACVSPHASVEVKYTGIKKWTSAPLSRSFVLHRGDELRCRTLAPCSTLYLAIEGGFEVVPVLGSFSTFSRGQCGGFDGRQLRAEDRLPLRLSSAVARSEQATRTVIPIDHTIRVVLGPQDNYFTAKGMSDFASSPYSICAGSNRMAMRLEGTPITLPRGHDLTSDAIALGSIQVAGDGQPIILLADHQTTGGYPKIATVISADIAKLGRLAIGQDVHFHVVDVKTAVEARREFLQTLHKPDLSITAVSGRSDMMKSTALMSENLISGVVSAEASA